MNEEEEMSNRYPLYIPNDYKKLKEEIREISQEINVDLRTCFNFNLGKNNVMNKYRVSDKLTESTFANIYCAVDLKDNKQVCIKKIKEDMKNFDQSLVEIYILKYLNKNSNADEKRILKLNEYFYYNVR